MPTRRAKPTPSSKKSKPVNAKTRALLDHIARIADEHPEKNPAAVALGRRGGLKGGRARMDSLSADERKALAVKAATARWGTRKP